MVTRWLVIAWGALTFASVTPDALATSSASSTEEGITQPLNVEPDIIVAQVRQKLAQPDIGRKTEAADRAALAAYYAERSGPPLWVTTGGFSSRALQVIAEIGKADDWGLSAAAFPLPKIGGGPQDTATLADTEIKLGLAVLKYARHARGGRLDPSQLSPFLDLRPNLHDPKSVIQAIATAPESDAYLRSLHPKHAQFERLRKALLASRGHDRSDRVQIPPGPMIRPGMRHPHVALARQRLGVAPDQAEAVYYDERLWQAIKGFQREHGLKPDGVITRATRSALNGSSMSSGRAVAQQLIVNMERWRWMPDELGELYVWDNVPEFAMNVVKKGQVVHAEKIIVGKLGTPTPIFSANMEFIVFHPEWGVPDSIKVAELWPYLAQGGGWYGEADTSILRRQNLRVSYNGRPVDPYEVDWASVDIRRFQFTQPAGADNVLGAIKFRFPNKHDVYMHDTPQRELFSRPVRLFSHGCIRVQNPHRLAEILLAEDKGWSASQVGDLLADRDNNYNKEVRLTRKIPVHVTYFTAVADDNGTVRYLADIYGHDERVAAALEGRPARLEVAAEAGDRDPRRRNWPSRRADRDEIIRSFDRIFGALLGN
jgi:murein L,D-transpeptidase YcbB/YkuD